MWHHFFFFLVFSHTHKHTHMYIHCMVHCPIEPRCYTCSVRHTSIFAVESSSISMQHQGRLSIHRFFFLFLCYLQCRTDFHMWTDPFVSDTKNFVYLCEDKWSTVFWHAGAETSQLDHRREGVDYLLFLCGYSIGRVRVGGCAECYYYWIFGSFYTVAGKVLLFIC